MRKLNSKQLRELTDTTIINSKKIKRYPVYFILENIYDTYNIGGLFRLADALAISKIYICGKSEIPPNHKIVKASIGTYKIVPWAYKKNVAEAIKEISTKQSNNIAIKQYNNMPVKFITIEQHPKAVIYTDYNYKLPTALIVGNETNGVTDKAIKQSSACVQIPMYGINRSLNVIIATSIVSYHVYNYLSL